MELASITISNFKGLRHVEIPASRFVCLIGENNSGKSSIMQAMLRFIDGKKLESTNYFDPNAQVRIAVRFESISTHDLALIPNEEHRSRFSEVVANGTATLVRKYEVGGVGRLKWVSKVPKDKRFRKQYLDSLIEGKKAGTPFAEELKKEFPEASDEFDAKTNQKQARSIIERLATQIPESDKFEEDSDIPTGIDNSLKPLLPEPIYIPAVKDFADEIATKDSATFGKLLGILLGQITPRFEDAKDTFERLRVLLNRIRQDDGSVLDTRLEAVRNIETRVQEYVRENFPRVEIEIEIPPPEVKTILSGAQIQVNDGVRGLIETKGDGLKRAVTFSILRSYVELNRAQKASGTGTQIQNNYLFLFEEPELYLHPTAQKILFDALAEISNTNHVFVSTHSPLFFGAEATRTFIKLVKKSDTQLAPTPFAQAFPVDLSDLDNKTRFQIISYETNNTAFFSETVVLVEGDSELIAIPHISRRLNPAWDFERTGIAICRIGGKGNILKYKKFFRAFDIRVCVIGDMDCVLDGFELLEPSEGSKKLREELLQSADEVIGTENIAGKLTSRDIREIQGSSIRREQFNALLDAIETFKSGDTTREHVETIENQFFQELRSSKRRQVIEDAARPAILTQRRRLFRMLRNEGIYLLEKGSIEDYYPREVQGPDKPSRAMDFCMRATTKEELSALCGNVISSDGVTEDKEFNVIFKGIFGPD